MHAAISWGFNLLEDREKLLLARLAVFDGGTTLESAEQICDGPTPLDVAEGLGVLVDRSFIRREENEGEEPRFVMLGTIREYGLQRLAESGEADAVRRAHALWFLRLAEQSEEKLQSEEQRRWSGQLESEKENIESAMQWSFSERETEVALRFAAALWWYWYLRGHYATGRRAIESALEGSEGVPALQKLRARALVGAGALAFLQCDYERASRHLDEAVDLAGDLHDRATVAEAVQFLGSISRERGDYARSLELHGRALKYFRDSGDRSSTARSLNYLGFASWLCGDYGTAHDVCAEAIGIFRELGDAEGTAWSTMNLAAAALGQGEMESAMALGKEALALSRELAFKEGIAWSLNILGVVSRRRSQNERAEGFLRKSFDFHWELGDRWRSASVLEALAGLRVDAAEFEAAATMLGAAAKLRESIGTPVPPAELFDYENDLERAVEALGRTKYDELAERTPLTAIHSLFAHRA
jgi:tetratricopeptide (TPR) repeat protein